MRLYKVQHDINVAKETIVYISRGKLGRYLERLGLLKRKVSNIYEGIIVTGDIVLVNPTVAEKYNLTDGEEITLEDIYSKRGKQ